MIALLVVIVAHPWIPQSRWLLVHMVTLGLVTTSIMVWGQQFTEALLKVRLGEVDRRRQVRRMHLLTLGIIVTCAGVVAGWPIAVMVGATMVGAALLWYALGLLAQLRVALPSRFEATVRTYAAAACLLPVGALLGALLSLDLGEPWQGRLLLAHQLVNVLGFVGLTVLSTLQTLWPTVLRTRLDEGAARRAPGLLRVMVVAVVGAAAAATLGSVLMGAMFLAAYLVCLLVLAVDLGRTAGRSARAVHRDPLPLFPVLSIGAGLLWFVGTVTALLVMWWRSADEVWAATVLAADLQLLTVPLVAGFLVQVLFGAMSHLLPTTMGGGPRAVRAGLARMSAAALTRVVVLNLALGLTVAAGMGSDGGDAVVAALSLGTLEGSGIGSAARVVLSALCLLALLAMPVTMVLAVREQRRLRRPEGLGMPGIGRPGAAPQPQPGSAAGPGSTAEPEPSAAATREPATSAPETSAVSDPTVLGRRRLGGAVLGAASVLGLTAAASSLDRASGSASARSGGIGAAVTETGETTTLAVSMADMRFTPDVLEVSAGDALVIELTNDDPYDAHDLVLANGVASGRLRPGGSTTVQAGVITQDLDGWCSIVGHRAMGMTLRVSTLGGSATDGSGTSPTTELDDLTPVTADLQSEPGIEARDAALPAATGPEQRLELVISEAERELAPGVDMAAMTFGGQVVGPVIRSELGARLTVDLRNEGSMGHSLDLHAGRVSPDEAMRTIQPGESLEYAITTDHAGVWLYHCSTMPMSVHLASGMLGALIVPPAGIAEVDHDWVLVQSDHYLVPSTEEDTAHAISSAKIAAGRPDFTVFNGHASQYVTEPLQARVGERVRIWVLAAGPSRGISFHVVGGVFDTVYKEGSYLLTPEEESGGGSQALDLAAAQGGFVELVFDEPGTYTAVNHSFADMERGARALIRITA